MNASGLNSRPSWPSSVKTGANETVITSNAKKSVGPTSFAAFPMISQCGFVPGIPFQMLVRVLDHHDGCIDHGPDRDRDAPERHDVGVQPLVRHHDERRQNGHGDRENGDEGRAEMQQEQEADEGHDHALLGQLLPQRLDRPLDEPAAVVDGDDLHALRQASLQLVQPGLDALNNLVDVDARAYDDDAADHFPFTVQLGEPASDVRAQLHGGDVLHRDRRPPTDRRQGRSA